MLYFNSSMVRLKEAVVDDAIVDDSKFQFQYGTIKSSSILTLQNPEPYFNSSMVRLKVSFQ